jgi:hypothetical protein
VEWNGISWKVWKASMGVSGTMSLILEKHQHQQLVRRRSLQGSLSFCDHTGFLTNQLPGNLDCSKDITSPSYDDLLEFMEPLA